MRTNVKSCQSKWLSFSDIEVTNFLLLTNFNSTSFNLLFSKCGLKKRPKD